MAEATSISQPTSSGGNVTVNSPGVIIAIVFAVVAASAFVVVALIRKVK